MWRQFLESLSHDESCFITLTYSDENLPERGSLEKDVVRLALDRIRKRISPKRFRYFYVGEYGDQTYRPHYHISLFGLSSHTPCEVSIAPGTKGIVTFDRIVQDCWPFGFVKVDEFNELTAQYVAGYVVKKLTNFSDPRLQGRFPEFARMSRRPGLGSKAMETIAKTLVESGHGMSLIEESGDVPRTLRIGRRSIPLGRYLLRRLREAVGFTPEYIQHIKASGAYESSVEMLALLQASLADAPLSSAKSAYLKEVTQKIRNVESRASIYKKRGSL